MSNPNSVVYGKKFVASLDTTEYDNVLSLTTKAYVDRKLKNISQQGHVVEYATTEILMGIFTSGNFQNGAVIESQSMVPLQIDGENVDVGDKILVKNQGVNSKQNGIYIVLRKGAQGTESYKIQRVSNAMLSSHFVYGMSVLVTKGALNARKCWFMSTEGVVTLDTTPIFFDEYGVTETTAGDGLLLEDNVISIKTQADSGIRILPDEILLDNNNSNVSVAFTTRGPIEKQIYKPSIVNLTLDIPRFEPSSTFQIMRPTTTGIDVLIFSEDLVEFQKYVLLNDSDIAFSLGFQFQISGLPLYLFGTLQTVSTISVPPRNKRKIMKIGETVYVF